MTGSGSTRRTASASGDRGRAHGAGGLHPPAGVGAQRRAGAGGGRAAGRRRGGGRRAVVHHHPHGRASSRASSSIPTPGAPRMRRRTPPSAGRPWPSAAARACRAGSVSLSPVSFLGVSGVDRVVLPSPNGSAISFALAEAGVTVVGACLRNARRRGRAGCATRPEATVSVVAAGRAVAGRSAAPRGRGPVGSRCGAGGLSARRAAVPEAGAAVAAFRAVAGRLGAGAVRLRQWAGAGRGRVRRRRRPGGGVRRGRGRAGALPATRSWTAQVVELATLELQDVPGRRRRRPRWPAAAVVALEVADLRWPW